MNHKLLSNRKISLGKLSNDERSFLSYLDRMLRANTNYFHMLHFLQGGVSSLSFGSATFDPLTPPSDLYLVAEDIVTRAGINQGLVLHPKYEGLREKIPNDGSYVSTVQAANLIGIEWSTVLREIKRGELDFKKVGNVTIVSRKSALNYKSRLRKDRT